MYTFFLQFLFFVCPSLAFSSFLLEVFLFGCLCISAVVEEQLLDKIFPPVVPCSWHSCLAAWHISVKIKDTWVLNWLQLWLAFNTHSKWVVILKHGVPWCLVLGPLLFLYQWSTSNIQLLIVQKYAFADDYYYYFTSRILLIKIKHLFNTLTLYQL